MLKTRGSQRAFLYFTQAITNIEGQKITTRSAWENKRRPEVLGFENNVLAKCQRRMIA